MPNFVFDHARPGEWTAALELAYGDLPAVERPAAVMHGLGLMLAGEIDPRGLRVARLGDALVGVQACIPLGGGCCLFWLPGVSAEYRGTDLPERLVRAGIDWSRAEGHKLGQMLLSPGQYAHAAPFLAAGFRQVTKLESMQHDLRELPPAGPLPSVRFETFGEGCRARFEQTLLRTYEESLDIPELTGVRSVEEILAGHRAAGKARPELWWLALVGAEPVGVVMLTEMADGLTWELSYLGVVPEHRRRGLGRALARQAIETARQSAVANLHVAVDLRNAPASQLYASLGFVAGEAQLVYLCFL